MPLRGMGDDRHRPYMYAFVPVISRIRFYRLGTEFYVFNARGALHQIGCKPGKSMAVSSGKPMRMLNACTACPEAPFIRLSVAARTTTRFEWGSRSKPTSHQLEPLSSFGSGYRCTPTFSLTIRMNGSSL